ncbi:acetyltransferase [Tritrichomonas foetus]|uniref:Acetyltransferase n=1 Tax=Tritrichomonas foetus TaxID=1144522 RepID=A0A1J4KLC7_9EUKA|nr:acetyltransferase [Tritrichomonas foetus]|eukprot:OHT10181.1 acetyltransferase [Tritrichomonas foetus]
MSDSAEVVIRHARPEEVTRIAEIEGICFPAAEACPLKDFQLRFSTFPENFFVADKNGEIIGFINGCNNDIPDLPDELYHDTSLHKKDGSYLTVFGIDVLPAHQKGGIGAKLMERYILWAKETGKKGVILTCKDHLVHWYEKFGYKKIGVSASCHGGAKWNDMHLIF